MNVTTMTGRTGQLVGPVYAKDHGGRSFVHRIAVSLMLLPGQDAGETRKPIAVVCRYHPDDVTPSPLPADAPGGDCGGHGPYAGDECPKCPDGGDA